MAGARKFGTFSGVFTPSILTILGVIMYLRLPAIVGQAGLWTAVGIILIAHVISVTTGLSVASVATDRKVRGGGTYYMLSRSLGLPIGGTLGIALFVGLSFAVSLYIIGFAESFLGFWGIEATRNAIRVTGTIVLVVVTGVTLVSTSLALRAQFFILAAIGLSLVSIVLGAGRHELGPAASGAALEPLPMAAPFIVLFGIFFPAVTGFEAGVSMSGDLREPKKSIPVGTIAAIVLGLAVYLALSAFLAYTVDARQLATNPGVLVEIALAPPLVLAGVWGATLSSALGSVLAAPRILQATSIDRITPAIFARGHGRDGEPRHALVLTFVFAGAGVLIGELDVIARVVSMFFITAYGFLNLACAIESWASPDFRPSFRVPRFVPVAGAAACAIVMIQLDLVAMIAATLLLGALYGVLARRQLQLESGDAWSGFWAAVARAALHRLDRSGEHRRNWRPNVLAFALSDVSRGPLLELGRELVGPRGMLTAIDVVEGHPERSGVARAPVGSSPAIDAYGVFARTVECTDAYSCVADIARYHGFAGVEPNALLVPWPDSPDARFAGLLDSLGALDQNVLLLTSPAQPTARRAVVDVWWWGEPDGAVLQLSLVRALVTNDTWRTARIRVLTCPAATGGADLGITRRMTKLLDEMRVDAAVHVIRDVQNRGLTDVIADESADADLVLVDARPFTARPRVIDVERAAAVGSRLRAALFTLPCASFAGEARGSSRSVRRVADASRAATVSTPRELPDLRLPADPVVADAVVRVRAALADVADACVSGPLREAYGHTGRLLERVQSLVDESLAEAAAADGLEPSRAARAIRKTYGDLLYHSGQLFSEHRERVLEQQAAALTECVDRLLGAAESLPAEFEPTLTVLRDRELFLPRTGDPVRVRAIKLYRRLMSGRRRTVRTVLPLRDLLRRRALGTGSLAERAAREFVVDAVAGVARAQTLLAAARDALDRIHQALERGDAERLATAERARLHEEAATMLETHRMSVLRATAAADRVVLHVTRRLATDLQRVDVSLRARIRASTRRSADRAARRVRELPAAWHESQTLLLSGAELDLTLLALRNRVATIVDRARDRLALDIRNGLMARLRSVRTALTDYIDRSAADPDAEFTRIFEQWPDFDAAGTIETLMMELREATVRLPDRVETLSPAAATRLADGLVDEPEIVSIALRPLVDLHFDAQFLGPLQERLTAVAPVCERATDAAQDAVRLTAFRLRDADADETAASAAGLMLSSALSRIDAALDELDAMLDRLDREIAAQLDDAFSGLESHRLLRETGRLPQYIRARRSREALTWFEEQHRRIRRFAGEQTVRLVYQRSEAVRFTRELEGRTRVDADHLVELVAAVSPDPGVFDRLPYHYRQLFLGKPGFSRDFWTGWGAERRHAAAALDRYRKGFEGPLLVLGEPSSGKSALAQAIAEEHFADASIYRITPPRERTTRPDDLVARIAEVVGAPVGTTDPLMALHAGSVMILEDLDRWWERDHNGYGALDTALELMQAHSARCVFILTADAHAFRFIDRVRAIRRRFLAIIECRPFSAREIADVIQLRHGSTGLVYEVDGVHEERLSDLARARFFHRLFEYSGGNIGAALHGWIAAISAVDGDRLTIDLPVPPRLDALDTLDPLCRLLLVQLILHRALPADRLLRLGGADPDHLVEPLAHLSRARVILEDARDGLVINPFLRPFITRRFAELELVE